MSHWLSKYRPDDLSEFSLDQKEQSKLETWLRDFKEKKQGIKPVLLISGPTGSGKTSFSYCLLENQGFIVKEYNITEKNSSESMREQLYDLLYNKSIMDIFRTQNTGERAKNSILMDDVDVINSTSDGRTSLSMFISVVANLDKKNNPSKTALKKKKSESSDSQPFRLPDTPIVCTATRIDDKKIRELEKYSCHVKLSPVSDKKAIKIIKHIAKKEKILIDDENVEQYVHNSPRPLNIRNLIIDLYGLYLGAKSKQYRKDNKNSTKSKSKSQKEGKNGKLKLKINSKDVTQSNEMMKNRSIDVKTLHSVHNLLSDKLPMDKCIKYYQMDELTVPLLMHENYISQSFVRPAPTKYKIKAIKEVSQSLSNFDYYQNSIFRTHSHQMAKYVGLYASVIPNYWVTALGESPPRTWIRQSSLLNRMSLYYNNRKLINGLRPMTLLKTSDMLYLSEIITWNLFTEFGSIDKAVEIMVNNNLLSNDLETLIRINKMQNNEYRKLLNPKFKQALEDKIEAYQHKMLVKRLKQKKKDAIVQALQNKSTSRPKSKSESKSKKKKTTDAEEESTKSTTKTKPKKKKTTTTVPIEEEDVEESVPKEKKKSKKVKEKKILKN